MSTNSEGSAEDVTDRLQAFMIQQIQAGADPSAITGKLVEMGIERTEAAPLVDAMYPQIMLARR